MFVLVFVSWDWSGKLAAASQSPMPRVPYQIHDAQNFHYISVYVCYQEHDMVNIDVNCV